MMAKSRPTRLLPIGSTLINTVRRASTAPPRHAWYSSRAPPPPPPCRAAALRPVIALSPKEAERRNSKLSFPFARRTLSQPHVMSAADVVFISGATGTNAALINGPYDRTSETRDGYALHVKRGNASMCMEHVKGKWIVKTVSNKGTASGFAWVAGNCAPDACTLRQWNLCDGTSWSNAPGVKMVAGAEAQRKVNGCCMQTELLTIIFPLPHVAFSIVCCDACCAGCRACRR